MTENKQFRVTIGNENDVRLVDYTDNKQLISISFKDYNDAVDCRDAFLYQCNMMNELHEENKKLKQVNEMLQMDFAITERNLIEENEQLKFDKQQLHRAMSREEVRYKQFQDKVFTLIDEKIKELSTTTNYGDIHEDLRIFAQQVLYDLKKGLCE